VALFDRFRRRRRRGLKTAGMAPGRRTYEAARRDRLFTSWIASALTSDAQLRMALPVLRARSRELAENADYARRFLKLLRSNVVGPQGIALKMRSRDERTGELDPDANLRIEERWRAWCRRGACTVDGRLSFEDLQELTIESVARDGELLLRKVRGFGNGFDFALQALEADHLDETHFDVLANGNEIRMGIEVNRWGRPVAYHVRTRHPGDDTVRGGGMLREFERIPAEDLNHAYMAERPTQSRGVPWLHTAMTRINMLAGYEEAELVAARLGASKMGFYKTETGQEYQGDDKDDAGNLIQEAEPGVFEQLPKGWSVETFDPDHPTTAFAEFEKAIARGISAGANLSTHVLTNDPTGVTYSTGRIFELIDRSYYQALQRWMISTVVRPVFEDWLTIQLDAGHLPLPARKIERFLAGARWQPRGWAWVDPQKEADGDRTAYALGVKSLTEIAGEKGRDLEEVFEEIAAERKLAAALGIVIDASGGKASAAAPPPAAMED